MQRAANRPEPPITGGEGPMLTAWLEYQRSTLLWKCDSLEGDQLVRPAVPPSPLTLLGLVRHMTYVEWYWFAHLFTGSSDPSPFSLEEDPDADFNDLRPSAAAADFDGFTRQCEVSRVILGNAPGLDSVAASPDRPVSLRWIMIHMIEEYARHNGHADLLREQVDGSVGE
jgi:hypothetical protein